MQLPNDERLHSINTYSRSYVENAGCNRMSSARPRGDPAQKISNRDCVLTRGGYSICLASSSRVQDEVSALIQRMYSWRGYKAENVEVSSKNANRLTIEASIGQQLVGTLTLGLDLEEGLLADKLYKQEINVFRTKEKKICELSKLAIDSEYSSKEILASLFHLAYIYGRNIHKSTDLFIEVNPRHARFYQRMLGLYPIGEQRICRRVMAPAVLMHLELDYADAQIASLAGSRERGEKSLYPYFFSPREEEGLAKTLRRYIN